MRTGNNLVVLIALMIVMIFASVTAQAQWGQRSELDRVLDNNSNMVRDLGRRLDANRREYRIRRLLNQIVYGAVDQYYDDRDFYTPSRQRQTRRARTDAYSDEEYIPNRRSVQPRIPLPSQRSEYACYSVYNMSGRYAQIRLNGSSTYRFGNGNSYIRPNAEVEINVPRNRPARLTAIIDTGYDVVEVPLKWHDGYYIIPPIE